MTQDGPFPLEVQGEPAGANTIPLAIPDLSGNEERYVLDAVRSTWISSIGPYLRRFEETFSTICGSRTCVGVCNGTMALHLALLAHDLQPGDEVLVPSLTYIATANAVRYCGAEPVFVDVDPNTWCIDPSLLEKNVSARTKGIIAVDLYGHPADMDAIHAIAKRLQLWVVEDSAEAHGARYKGRPVGSLAAINTFSFYGNKTIASGEGGAVTLSDPDLEEKVRILRGQGMDPKRRYYFPITGYNYRMTNLVAAILCAQLERMDAILNRRREIFAQYSRRLASVAGIHLQPIAPWAEPNPWLMSVLVEASTFGKNRDHVASFLEANGVETRPFFIPLHTLPPFCVQSRARGEELPITLKLASQGLNLPTFNQITRQQIDRVCDLLIQAGRQ